MHSNCCEQTGCWAWSRHFNWSIGPIPYYAVYTSGSGMRTGLRPTTNRERSSSRQVRGTECREWKHKAKLVETEATVTSTIHIERLQCHIERRLLSLLFLEANCIYIGRGNINSLSSVCSREDTLLLVVPARGLTWQLFGSTPMKRWSRRRRGSIFWWGYQHICYDKAYFLRCFICQLL